VRRKLEAAFDGKSVLVTGHTGFKGAWISMALRSFGARVSGYSIDVPTEPSIFRNLSEEIFENSQWGDVADKPAMNKFMQETNPDFVFHLAAQPLVSRSYEDPLLTVQSNTLGTLVVADAIRSLEKEVTAIFITSDKCYENIEQIWGYSENDKLGGSDIYSASKAAAEILLSAYHRSFLTKGNMKMATARAGNVIGGGDWSPNRVVPDIITSHRAGKEVLLRSPDSTRPWQHVLEPVIGYLLLSVNLAENLVDSGESYNFGPALRPRTVRDLFNQMKAHIPDLREANRKSEPDFHEAGLLALNCEKAFAHFGWAPVLNFEETIRFTVDWYSQFYSGKSVNDICQDQISEYLAKMGADD